MAEENTRPTNLPAQLLLATPQAGQLATGGNVQFNMESITTLAKRRAEVAMAKAVSAALADKRAADGVVTAARQAYDAAIAALPAPADFVSDLRRLVAAVRLFKPAADILSTAGRPISDADTTPDIGRQVTSNRVTLRYAVSAAIKTTGGAAVIEVARDYPFPPDVVALSSAVDAAETGLVAAAKRVDELAEAKRRLPDLIEDTKAAMITAQLRSMDGGDAMLDAIDVSVEQWAQGLNVPVPAAHPTKVKAIKG